VFEVMILFGRNYVFSFPYSFLRSPPVLSTLTIALKETRFHL